MKTIFHLLCVAALFSSCASAQSLFFEKGHSGIGLQGGFYMSSPVNGALMSAGYCINGIVGLSLGYATASYDGSGENTTGTSFAQSVEFIPTKEDDIGKFVSVILSVSHSSISINPSNAIEYINGVPYSTSYSISGDAFSLSAGLAKNITLSPKAKLILLFAISHSITSETATSGGFTSSASDDETFGSASATGLVQVSPTVNLGVTPEWEHNNNADTFSVQLGVFIDTSI